MNTSKKQVQMIENICIEIETHPNVSNCQINDYGKYGNFDIFIEPKEMKRTNTNVFKSLVNKAIQKITKENGDGIDIPEIRTYYAPYVTKREWCYHTEKSVIKCYDKKYWTFDIDFNQYDKESNSFS